MKNLCRLIRTLAFGKNWNNSRTDASLDFLNKETQRFNTYMDKLNADNWKFNLIGLYFTINYTTEDIAKSNEQSDNFTFVTLTFQIKLKGRDDEHEKELLYQQYAVTVFDMCSHYENIYKRLEQDMNGVKTQLLKDFSV